VVWSPATRFETLKSFVFPLVSSPRALDVPNCNLNPLLPYVIPVNALGIHLPVEVSVTPKVSGPSAVPSTKLYSAI